MTLRRNGASVEPSLTEKDLLTQEIWVARRAGDITAELVVEQFEKMEEIQRRLEQKAATRKCAQLAADFVPRGPSPE